MCITTPPQPRSSSSMGVFHSSCFHSKRSLSCCFSIWMGLLLVNMMIACVYYYCTAVSFVGWVPSLKMVSPSPFVLSRASTGIPIAHETIGKAGSVSWLYAAPFRHDLRNLEEWFSNEESVKLRASDDFQLFPVVRRGVYR